MTWIMFLNYSLLRKIFEMIIVFYRRRTPEEALIHVKPPSQSFSQARTNGATLTSPKCRNSVIDPVTCKHYIFKLSQVNIPS